MNRPPVGETRLSVVTSGSSVLNVAKLTPPCTPALWALTDAGNINSNPTHDTHRTFRRSRSNIRTATDTIRIMIGFSAAHPAADMDYAFGMLLEPQ
jgi:hypothetical protein